MSVPINEVLPPFSHHSICMARMATEEAIHVYSKRMAIAVKVLIAFGICFAACLAGLAITAYVSSFIMGTATIIALIVFSSLLFVSIITMIAAVLIKSMNGKYAAGARKWEEIYNAFSKGDYEYAIESIATFIEPGFFDDSPKKMSQRFSWLNKFKKSPKNNFYYLDMRYPDVTSFQNLCLLPTVFAHIILICLFKKMQKEGIYTLTEKDKKLLALADDFTGTQRCGKKEFEKAMFSYIRGTNKIPYKNVTHKEINHEYSLIDSIFRMYTCSKYSFNNKDEIISGGASYDNIENIQKSLLIAKRSLVRKKKYNVFERSILEPVLKATTGKEFVESIKKITKTNSLLRKKIEEKIIEWKVPNSEWFKRNLFSKTTSYMDTNLIIKVI